MRSLLSMLAVAAFLSSGAAFAADSKPATDAAGTAKVATTQKMKKHHEASVQSEKSKKCSADADAQKLHGKARKAFRKHCMKTV